MGLRVSGRHMDVGEAFRSRIVDRLNELVAKYFDGNFSGATVLSKEGARYCADITLHLDSGVDFQATADTHDPESSFIEASEKIEKRLRRYKRRLKDHKAAAAGSREIAYTVISSVPDEADEVPEDFAPAVIAETSLVMGTMSVANAVMELDRRDGPVVVFKNGATEEVNIVYRRPDGNVGWIDPSTLRARV